MDTWHAKDVGGALDAGFAAELKNISVGSLNTREWHSGQSVHIVRRSYNQRHIPKYLLWLSRDAEVFAELERMDPNNVHATDVVLDDFGKFLSPTGTCL